MNEYLVPAVAALLTPVLALVWARLLGEVASLKALVADRGATTSLAALFAVSAAAALLPWAARGDGWIWAWALLELAVLTTYLPALASGHPPTAYGVMRSLQIGAWGRVAFWACLLPAFALDPSQSDWRVWLVRGLALLGAALALPAALERGAWANNQSFAAGLGPLGRWANHSREIVLAMALGVAVAPPAMLATRPLAAIAAVALVALIVARGLGRAPLLSARHALQLPWLACAVALLAGASLLWL